MRRLLGLRDLVHDAIDAITTLVEETHEDVARKPVAALSRLDPLGGIASVAREVDGVRRGVARLAFDGVRGTNRAVQALCDRGIELAMRGVPSGFETELVPNAFVAWVEQAESALNGVVGDYLASRGNPLATDMQLRQGGRALALNQSELAAALPHATGKVVVFVHGLSSSDSVWVPSVRAAAAGSLSFGDEVARSLGYTPLYVRYNSGLPIADNGRALALLLTELGAAYPVPIESLALVGHSMGGLVAQSAALTARELGEPWLVHLEHVLAIGTPHFGAPLARAGDVVSSVAAFFDTAATQVSAKVLRARSAGIKDLSFGGWREEGATGLRFVEGVTYGAIAARYRVSGSRGAEWMGDLLVHVPSASGRHSDATRQIPFHLRHVVDGVHHVALTTHPDVYRQLERFLRG
ncbi:MAG TPA: hypothetical protein VMG12_12130 [Polyangiaceae bacterium]|nr:hypothetical protein [Polyangiaceae bacterium]